MSVFKKSKGCTPTGIMRHLNAGEVVFLVVTDKDSGRLRIESYKFEPSKRMVSGRELAAWWVYPRGGEVPGCGELIAGMCYAKDRDTWLALAEKYGRHTVPGIEDTYKKHFEWYLNGEGGHFFNDSVKINAEYELFYSDNAEGFCGGIEREFAEFYFDKYITP